MADYLKSFVENEKILASETNANNQYLLNQITDRFEELQAYLKREVAKLQGSFIQPGFIIGVPFDHLPEGFYRCDGTSYLISDEPDLYAAIGATYGQEDDYHFNVPDFTGMFLRGAGSANSASLGVLQKNGVPNILGSIMFGGTESGSPAEATGAFYGSGQGGYRGHGHDNAAVNPRARFDASRCSDVYQNDLLEVRPDNYSVHWLIKR
jgi:hypothetical protein